MKRTKLRAMVQSAIAPQHQISTEGFLGDIASKISGLFSNRKKLLSDGESKKLLEDNKALVARLKETVLNSKWMEKATLKTGKITAAWAVPGLDYNSELSEGSVVQHLEKTVPKFIHDCTAFRSLQQKYSDDTNAMYDHFLTEIVSAIKEGKDIDAVIKKYDERSKAIADPIKSLKTKPLLVFENKKLTYNEKTKSVDVVSTGNSKIDSIPPLTKEEITFVANSLVKLIESPLATDEGLHYVIDWEDIRFKLDKAGIPEDLAEDAVEKFNDSVFMSRFYHQYAWSNSGTYDVIWEHQSLIKRLFQLLDASIK